jgi:Fic family protein
MIDDRLNKRIKFSNRILLRIAEIDELKGRWGGSISLNPRILGQLKRSVIITSTGASTRIEGSRMSDADVDRFLRGLHQKAPQGRDEEEVAGYADILGRIFDHYDTIKITEGSIRHLHDLMLKFSKKDEPHRGKYKTEDNTVAIVEKGEVKEILFKPTPPWLVKKEMDDLLSWLHDAVEKKEVHPLVIIANVIFEFLAIHPFKDGNGRLSRALTNLMLLQQGYAFVPYVSLEEIIESRQSEYYLALRQTQKNHKTDAENIEPWLLFFLDCVHTQTKQALALLEGNDSHKLLSGMQKQIYEHLSAGGELGVSEIRRVTGISLSTVKQSLSRLVAHGLIERLGQGRATRYKKRS